MMPSRRGAMAFVLVLAMAVGLVGCGSMKPLPSDTFYRLKITPPVAEDQNGARWTEKVIRVTKFHASGVYRERAMVFTEDDQVVVKQHRYHLWIDSPERMLQNELIRYLRAAGVAPAITDSDLGGDGFEIRGRIRQMDQIIETETTRVVVVALAFELLDRGSGKTLVFGREYRETRTVPSGDMGATASAMSAAVGAIFDRFAADAGSALRQ